MKHPKRRQNHCYKLFLLLWNILQSAEGIKQASCKQEFGTVITPNDGQTSASRRYSPVNIGIRDAFLNMFNALPSPSASAFATRLTTASPLASAFSSVPNHIPLNNQEVMSQSTNSFHSTKEFQQEKMTNNETRGDVRNLHTKKHAASGMTTSKSIPSSPATITFFESMICGAVSRAIAHGISHPANAMKTLLQLPKNDANQAITLSFLVRPSNFRLLTRGAGAQVLMSIPIGAATFSVLEFTKKFLKKSIIHTPSSSNDVTSKGSTSAGIDFLSSSLSTVTCSALSTPQMVIMDNIMAGKYPNFASAVTGLASKGGLRSFYAGWQPHMAKLIPSDGLIWVFFEQLKVAHFRTFDRPLKNTDNLVLACISSAVSVCIMIPMDTIKTRLVIQDHNPKFVPYKGIRDCASRVIEEEGMIALYRGLMPRLMSVVPYIGIQLGMYEFMKRMCIHSKRAERMKESEALLRL